MALLSLNEFAASKLHLVIWNRVDNAHHKAAMEALFRIMSKPYANEVMPLIRPLGRGCNDSADYHRCGNFRGTDFAKIGETPWLDPAHTAHCEVWFQVSERADKKLRKDVESEFGNIGTSCFFWEHVDPMRAPFVNHLGSTEYASSRGNKHKKLVDSMDDDQVALLVKGIWHQATPVIFDHYGGAAYAAIDPRTSSRLSEIGKLMEALLRDIDLKEWGLSDSELIIDPTDLGASHLSAFAINSITAVVPMYALEHFRPDSGITRPTKHNSRDEFLNLFKL